MHIAVLLRKNITTSLKFQVNCQRIPNLSTGIVILLCALRIFYFILFFLLMVAATVLEIHFFFPSTTLIKIYRVVNRLSIAILKFQIYCKCNAIFCLSYSDVVY